VATVADAVVAVNRRHLDALHRRMAMSVLGEEELGAARTGDRGCIPLAVAYNPDEM
jgi:hypothetical protein